MARKNYSLIPVLAAIVMIPQIIFWWFVPVPAAAHLAVYIGGTVLTVGIPLACFLTCWKSNIRKTTGLFVIGCVLEAVTVALSALLLALNVSVRSVVFSFIIAMLVCLIALIPLISSAVMQQRQGLCPDAVSEEPSDLPMREVREHSDRTPDVLPHRPAPPRASPPTPTVRPLPPRNR